jgi:cation transport ATPase
VRQVMGGAPQSVWLVRDTVEVKVPFTEVKEGDLIVVNRGEFIPVTGLVTTGAAKVNLLLITRSPTSVEVGVGDTVYPTAFVVEGRLQVRVEKLPATG